MTAPSKRQQKPTNAGRSFGLQVVRRADVRRLAESGPPRGWLPKAHADLGDPRYPRPRRLRKALAITIDIVVHLAIGIAVGIAVGAKQAPAAAVFVAIGAYLVLSILDRIVLQRLCQATVGKLLTGVRVIRDDTGGAPTTGSLVLAWLGGVLVVLLS